MENVYQHHNMIAHWTYHSYYYNNNKALFLKFCNEDYFSIHIYIYIYIFSLCPGFCIEGYFSRVECELFFSFFTIFLDSMLWSCNWASRLLCAMWIYWKELVLRQISFWSILLWQSNLHLIWYLLGPCLFGWLAVLDWLGVEECLNFRTTNYVLSSVMW